MVSAGYRRKGIIPPKKVKFPLECLTWIILLSSMKSSFALPDIQYHVNDSQLFQENLLLTSKTDYIGCSFDVYQGKKLIYKISNKNILKDKRSVISLPVGSIGAEIKVLNAKCDIERSVISKNISSNKNSYESIVDGIIKFLEYEQIKKDQYQKYYKGEWGSVIFTRNYIPLISPPKNSEFYDSNCYVTASIYNILAENYFLISSDLKNRIINMLELAKDNVISCMPFKVNFYPFVG